MFLPFRNQVGNQVHNQESNQAINQGRDFAPGTHRQHGMYRSRPLGEPTRRPVRNRRSRPAPAAHHWELNAYGVVIKEICCVRVSGVSLRPDTHQTVPEHHGVAYHAGMPGV